MQLFRTLDNDKQDAYSITQHIKITRIFKYYTWLIMCVVPKTQYYELTVHLIASEASLATLISIN